MTLYVSGQSKADLQMPSVQRCDSSHLINVGMGNLQGDDGRYLFLANAFI